MVGVHHPLSNQWTASYPREKTPLLFCWFHLAKGKVFAPAKSQTLNHLNSDSGYLRKEWPERTMRAYSNDGGVTPVILDLGTRRSAQIQAPLF
jgi:hypothetical protein